MRSFLSTALGCLAKTIALFFAVLFVILALVALVLFNVDQKLLEPEIYKAALAENEIYESLPVLMGQQIIRAMTYNPCQEDPSLCEGEGEGGGEPEEEGGPPEYFRYLSEEEWESIFRELMPAAWIRTQVEGALDQAFAYLKDDTVSPEIKIATRDIKDRLLTGAGIEIGMRMLQSMPPCTAEEVAQFFGEGIAEGEMGLPPCCPPDEILSLFPDMLEGMLGELSQQLPDEYAIDLSTLFEPGEEAPPATPPTRLQELLDDPRASFRLARLGMRLSPLVALVLLVPIALFGVRSWKGLLQWWGFPFLLVGLLAGGSAVLSAPLLGYGIPALLSQQAPSALSPILMDKVIGVVDLIARRLMYAIAIQAGLVGLVGLIMAVASFVVPGRRKEPVAAEVYGTPTPPPEDENA